MCLKVMSTLKLKVKYLTTVLSGNHCLLSILQHLNGLAVNKYLAPARLRLKPLLTDSLTLSLTQVSLQTQLTKIHMLDYPVQTLSHSAHYQAS